METITHPNISLSLEHGNTSESVVAKFFRWCNGQQHNRLLWLGVALTAHGCILTPATIIAVVLSGSNLILFMAAIVAMGMAVVTNLAALPTKITIPVFFLSLIMDVIIIILAAIEGFDIAKTYI